MLSVLPVAVWVERGRNLDSYLELRIQENKMQQNQSSAKTGLALAVVLMACTAVWTQDVTSNAMPGTNFAKYKTYKWIAIEGAAKPDQITDAMIKQSVDSQLTAKGLTKTDGDNADLDVGYQAALNEERQWNAYGTGGVRWGGGMGTATSSTIVIGTLVLDMYDPAPKQLVWSGRATKTLDPNANQEKKQKNLDKAMAKLLESFSPK